jgi:hypothetical protein
MQVLTARSEYINILTELVKEEAPVLYLEDYLYYYNKAISEYMKARYELYETNQQLADDLRFWKKEFNTTSLSIPINSIYKTVGNKKMFYYRHLLSCIISVDLSRPVFKCSQLPETTLPYKAVRMSSEMKAGMLDNVYLRPEFYRPYFEIIDNEIRIKAGEIDIKSVKISNILIEYLCHPAQVDLTEAQIDSNVDTSQVLEFSYDVGQEILKVAMKLILERGSNPRLQSNVAINQTISDFSTGLRGGGGK